MAEPYVEEAALAETVNTALFTVKLIEDVAVL